MPREIFADEIERFLESLDGVSSARVLTAPGGDISYVYVTTESPLDSRGMRRGVVAALQSRFGIPIDDARVRVTQLRAGVQRDEIPRFRVVRVEETATAGDLAVTVKLQWARGSDVRSATGQARGRGGGAQRPRALAAATIAAVRDALDVTPGALSLERVGTVTFLDRPMVLVAVSAGTRGAARTFVGAAFEDEASSAAEPGPDEAAEPPVTAALDAVTRWLLQAALAADPSRAAYRRERLEAMRHFVLDAADPPAAMTSPLRPVHREEAEAAAGAAEAGGGRGSASRIAPVRPLPSLGPAQNGQNRAVHETQGGTEMGLQHEAPDTPSGTRGARPVSVEDGFYRSLVAERTPVHLRCRDGYEVPRAIVRDAGTYALLVETRDGLELFFKHAIISIRVLPQPAAQA